MLNFGLWLIGTKIGRLTAFVMAAVLVTTILYGMAYQSGRTAILQKQAERTIEAWNARSRIDAATEILEHYDLCVELGGLPGDCARQLRRVDEAAKP